MNVRATRLAVLLTSASLLHPARSRAEPADDGEWNDLAALFYGSTKNRPECTGTLIAPDLVLTTAACIGGITSVKLGVDDWTSPAGEVIPVARQLEHPDAATTHDVGLVFLERESSIEPRVLADGCVADNWLQEGADVIVVGYGTLRSGDDDGGRTALREAETTIFDGDCAGSAACNQSIGPSGEVAAGDSDPDACVGDDGGPLYLRGPDKIAYLVGASSRSYDRPPGRCSGRRIYVRPDAVVDWIESASGRELPLPSCNSAPVLTADAGELLVEGGGIAIANLAVSDPDAADRHRFAVWHPPAHGELIIDQTGFLIYVAADRYGGSDGFTVVVSDSGIPTLSSELTFSVWIRPHSVPTPPRFQQELVSGCSGGGGRAGAVAPLAVLLAVGRLRRRRPPRRRGG